MKAIPIFPLAALMLAAACGGSPTATTGSPLSWGLRDFIEALFLGDGPLSVGQPSGFMGGFPVGSQITVTFLNTVNEDQRRGVQELTAACGIITVARDPGGLYGAIPCSMGLTFTYSETSDRERMEDALLQGGPKPPKNEVWVYQTDGACPVRGEAEHAVLGQPGGGDSFTQNYYEAGSRVTLAAIICLGRGATDYEAAHETGHALGFQDLRRFLDIDSWMMRPDSYYCFLSEFEFGVVEAVYAAGLRPGDGRQDFINAGLIEP